MIPSLVLFDLDGTLLNTLADLHVALQFALQKNGLPARTQEEVRAFVGNGIRRLIARGVPAGTPAPVENAVYADFCAYYGAHCTDATSPYAGVPELLTALGTAGIKTAMLSNKADAVVQALARRYFDGVFAYVAGERGGVPKKPAPDIVFAALAALGVPKERAVLVGDSEVDIATAQNAGVPCISVTWGFKDKSFLLANGARTLVSSPAELLPLLTFGRPWER